VPKLPDRKPVSKDGEQKLGTDRPYTRMAMSGLSAGLTMPDLRNIKYTHLMQMLWEWDEMHGAEYDETVEATSADVMSLTKL